MSLKRAIEVDPSGRGGPRLVRARGIMALDDDLLRAAREGNIEEMRALIAAGADVRTAFHGETALHQAASAGHTAAVELLLENRDSLDAAVSHTTCKTPLHEAAQRGHAGCITALLMAGADANAKTPRGATPLHLVPFAPEKKKGIACARLLIRAGAEVDTKDGEGKTPLYWAFHRKRFYPPPRLHYDSRSLAKTLLRAGAVVDQALSPWIKGATRDFCECIKATGGWKPYAAKHKRVLAGLVVKCTKRSFPLDAAGHVVDFICPEGGY